MMQNFGGCMLNQRLYWIVAIALLLCGKNVYASHYTPESSEVRISSTASGDLLVVNPVNAYGVSINHFSRFEVEARPLQIVNSTVENLSANPNLIVIITDDVIIRNKIEFLGLSGDLLILSDDPNGTIECTNCEFRNIYRLTMANHETEKSFGSDVAEIGTITTSPDSTIILDNLFAPGLLSFDIIGGAVQTRNTIDLHERAVKDGSTYARDENGSYKIGSTTLGIFAGEYTFDFETRQIVTHNSSFRNFDPTANISIDLSGQIYSTAVNIYLTEPTYLNALIDTRSDLVTSIRYGGINRISPEQIKIVAFYNIHSVINNNYFTNGNLTINTIGSLHINKDIVANTTKIIAEKFIRNFATISGNLVEIAASSVINNESIIVEDTINIWAESYIINQDGAELLADSVNLQSDLTDTSFVLNGARSPMDISISEEVSKNPIYAYDGSYYDDIDAVKLGTYYQVRNGGFFDLSHYASIGTDRFDESHAHIRANQINIKTKYFENINPFYRISDGTDTFSLQRKYLNQVSLIGEQQVNIHAEKSILNSSAYLGVEQEDGLVQLISDVVVNERYRVLSTLDMEYYIGDQQVASSSNDTTDTVVTKTAVYSPPGVIYSMGDVQVSGTNLVLNSISYLEIMGDFSITSNRFIDSGMAHQSIQEDLRRIDYEGVECNPCEWESSEFVVTTGKELDSLLYVNGNTYGTQTNFTLFSDYKPLDGFLDYALENLLEDFNWVGNLDTLETDADSYFYNDQINQQPWDSLQDYDSRSSLSGVIDHENQQILITWYEQQSFVDRRPYSSTHNEFIQEYDSGSSGWSFYEALVDLMSDIYQWIGDVFNEIDFWSE